MHTVTSLTLHAASYLNAAGAQNALEVADVEDSDVARIELLERATNALPVFEQLQQNERVVAGHNRHVV